MTYRWGSPGGAWCRFSGRISPFAGDADGIYRPLHIRHRHGGVADRLQMLGVTFSTNVAPPVAAAVTMKLPASIWLMMRCSAAASFSTPRTSITFGAAAPRTSAPQPYSGSLPILRRTWGLGAVFRMVCLCHHSGEHTVHVVTPIPLDKEDMGNVQFLWHALYSYRSPRCPRTSALNTLRCWSTGRGPRLQPPGMATCALPKRESSAPRK